MTYLEAVEKMEGIAAGRYATVEYRTIWYEGEATHECALSTNTENGPVSSRVGSLDHPQTWELSFAVLAENMAPTTEPQHP